MPVFDERPWFKPQQPRVEEVLRKFIYASDSVGNFEIEDPKQEYKILKDAGLARIDHVDFASCAYGRLYQHAMTYFDDKQAWEEHKAKEQEKADAELRSSRKHDWALNVVNGVYALVGALIGIIATLIFR